MGEDQGTPKEAEFDALSPDGAAVTRVNKGAVLLSSLRGGGAEHQLLVLTRELVQRGWDLDLVLVNGKDSAYVASPAIRVVSLDAARIRYAPFPLARYLRTVQPDVMLTAETPVNLLAILTRLLTGFPRRLIVSERNHLSEVARHASRLVDRLRPAFVRRLYPKADLVIGVSSGVTEDLVRSCHLPESKVRVIYNMFDIDEISDRALLKPKDPWFRNAAAPIIVNVGRLVEQKDQASLIKAFAIVRSKKDCRLLILGEGPERNRLSELATYLGVDNDLYMPGFVPEPYAYVASSALCVLSSAWEGLPGALIEAMACGTPVVSTDCRSGPAEILENGRFGMLTPVGDPAALAQAILATLEHPLVSEVLRRRARDFSIQSILPQYMSIFQQEPLQSGGR